MLYINKEPNADSRSAKKDPTLAELKRATEAHIEHVQMGLGFFAELLKKAGEDHDNTKISRMGEFHQALTSGKIKNSDWYEDHVTEERHHLKTKVPKNVTLVDVFEHLTDCVMAGMARSGEVYDVDIDPRILEEAAKNTVELLKKNITVGEAPKDDLLDEEI